MELRGRSMSARLNSRKSSLGAPKRHASMHVSTRTSSNAVASPTTSNTSEAASQRRRSVLTRKSPAQGCSKKPLTELGKETISNLKAFEKQLPNTPSVSTVKKGRFSTGSFTVNPTQKSHKADTKFKAATISKENSLNATYCLPSSEDMSMRQIPRKEDLDMLMVRENLPNVGISKSRPEREQTESNLCPLPFMESRNLSPLFTSFIAEECLHIAAKLNDKSEICPFPTVGTVNPTPVTGVSMINEEPVPLDSSVYSCCSNTSPAKSPLLCTSKFKENIFDMSSQQKFTEAEIKTGDLPVGTRMNNDYIETGTLPLSPSGNLIQFNETVTQGYLNDEKDNALEHEVYSSNVLSKSPTTVEYIQLNVPEVLSDASTTCLGAKNDAASTFMPTKIQSNSKLSLSKVDLLLSERSMLSGKICLSPKHSSFENEFEPPDLLGCTPPLNLSTDLIQLNDTMMVKDNKNVTFDLSKHESSFGKGLQTSSLSNFKQSVSPQELEQFNVTINVDDFKNATFDTSKYKDLGNDFSCKLPVSLREGIQLNATMTLDDHKNATFDASKHEGCLANDDLSNCELSLSTTNQDQLLTHSTINHKVTTFDAPKREGSLENNPNKTINLANCKLSSSSDSNEVRLTLKNLKLVRKDDALASRSELEQVQMNGKNNYSNLSLNFKSSDCTEKRSSEINQGEDVSISAELREGVCASERSLPVVDVSQKKEQSLGEHADSFHDLVSSEWAPNCISTPCLAGKQNFPEYLQLDRSFLASSSTLQDDVCGVGKCSNEQDSTNNAARTSGTDVPGTKFSGRKPSNASSQQLQQTKMGNENSLKRVSYLPAARKKNISEASVSEICKPGAEKDIVTPLAQMCKIGSSAERGKPSIQPPGFSKLCLPKPHRLSGKLSQAVATRHVSGNNKLPSYHNGISTKMSPKIKSTQLLAKGISKIPGVKRTSSVVSSKLTMQETKAELKSELFNIGIAGPSHVNRKANKPLVLDPQNVVTGIKRTNSAVEHKRGEVTTKYAKPKPLLGNCKPKIAMKARESLTSESKVKMINTAVEESTFKSKQELEVDGTPWTPSDFTFSISLPWGTLSNTLLKSTYVTFTAFPSSINFVTSSKNSIKLSGFREKIKSWKRKLQCWNCKMLLFGRGKRILPPSQKKDLVSSAHCLITSPFKCVKRTFVNLTTIQIMWNDFLIHNYFVSGQINQIQN
ncbi:uncharacterized protein LOC125458716 isoform X2 [Stegostoma tigrinum]|uniref:uncharacterized protein LOC125458716 isoform X2 n=1 Tax=Stegostoma tigrinum TaxID=3053191 RepID=UPI0028701F55|nr:uncharacterized protein LOC125458716 isoform X2 [Stegostoma tigrinum]